MYHINRTVGILIKSHRIFRHVDGSDKFYDIVFDLKLLIGINFKCTVEQSAPTQVIMSRL